MKTILGDIDRNLVAEKKQLLVLRQTRPARALSVVRHKLLATIRRATAMQNLSLIIAVEKSLVEYDLTHHANSHAMVASLRTAIDELQAVEHHLALVADASAYGIVNQAHSLRKKRKAGLPFDDARQALASHHVRLTNLDKSRLEEDEKQLIDARKAAIDTAQKLYIAQQLDALGVEPSDEA